MEIDSNRNAYASGVTSLMTAAANDTAAAIKTTDEDGKASLVDEIREKGFSAYAEEERQKKIEELREEILEAMGLSNEDLAKMPPEQRRQLEEMIAQEIRERLNTASELDDGKDKRDEALLKAKEMLGPVSTSSMLSSGMGLGPLLALQEAEAATEQKPPTVDEDAG